MIDPATEQLAGLYDDGFYASRERYRAIYDTFAGWLFDRYQPRRVLDIGSGAAYLLSGFAARGCTVLGVEGSPSAFPHIPAAIPTMRLDLRQAGRLMPLIQPYWDLTASVEVVEHIDAAYEDDFCQTLAALTSMRLFFTAAPTGKPPLHVNCRPKEYWIAKMQALGLVYDSKATEAFSASCRPRGCVWVCDNAMIFQREGVRA